jgi:hypothetical protein
VDDSTIQSENTSNSTDYGPSNSKEASDDSASDDGRSLSDSLYRGASPPMESPAPDFLEASEVMVEESKEEPIEYVFSSKASKKNKKKSKVAVEREWERAVVECD